LNVALDLLTKFIPAPVSIKYRLVPVPDRTPMDKSLPVVACTRMMSLEVLVVSFPLLVPYSPCFFVAARWRKVSLADRLKISAVICGMSYLVALETFYFRPFL
jgi:hypothetical protein